MIHRYMGMVKKGFGIVWLLSVLGVSLLHAQFGTLDASFKPTVNGTVRAMVTQHDGKMVIVGDFTSVNGNGCRGVARYNSDGTFDPTFAAGLAGVNGTVYCVALNGGKILIGGEFTTVHGVLRNRVAQLNTDGTLDVDFDAGSGPNGTVYAVAWNSEYGGVLIGGAFTRVYGYTRNRLAMLYSGGIINPDRFNGTGANDVVYAICVPPSNYSEVYVGGAFTTMNGVNRNRLALFTTAGSLNTTYNDARSNPLVSNPGPDGVVYAIADMGGYMAVGGDFNSVDYVSRPKLAFFNRASSVGAAFYAGVPKFNINGAVRTLFPYTDSKTPMMLAGGDFTSIDGVACNRAALFRWGANVSVDSTFVSGANGSIYAFGRQKDGKTLIGGAFTSVDGVSQPYSSRLLGPSGAARPASPALPVVGVLSENDMAVVWKGVDNTLGHRIERSLDGVNWSSIADGVPVSPYYDKGLSAGTTYHYRIVAYSSNGDSQPSPVNTKVTLSTPWDKAGALDRTYVGCNFSAANALCYSTIRCLAQQADGKILLGGAFWIYWEPTVIWGVSRVNGQDGSLDKSFVLPYVNGNVYAMAVQSDGKILIGGNFTQVNAVSRPGLARLNENGTVDATYVPTKAYTGVWGIELCPDGKALLQTGVTINSSSYSITDRVNIDGSSDPSFQSDLSDTRFIRVGMVLQPDGKVVIGGWQLIASYSAQVFRIKQDGRVDDTFQAGAVSGNLISVIKGLPDGKLLVGGDFTVYNGVNRGGIVRLNPDGSIDESFDPENQIRANGSIQQIAVQTDGKIILGGLFSVIGDKIRMGFARLNQDGSLDSTFDPGFGSVGSLPQLMLQPDGKLILVGISTYNGKSVGAVARLLGDNGTSTPVSATAVTAAATSTGSTQLSWNSVSYTSGYQIYQSLDGMNDWTLVGAVPSASTSITITGLQPGTSRYYRVRAYNSNGPAADSVMVTGTSYTPYQQWKVNKSLAPNAPDTDDAIGKGVPHLLDYAFGGDPLAYDAEAILPRLDVPDNQMQISFWCDTERTDLVYTVQASSDLIRWEDIAQSTSGTAVAAVNGNSVIADSGSGRRKVSVTDATTIGSTQQRYLRVKVTTP